jgi:glycosyltransferase involved in cell wall biosynthesis
VRVLHVDTATELRGGQRQLAYLLAARPQDGWAGVVGAPLAAIVGPPSVALRRGADPRNLLPLRRAAAAYDLVAAHTPHAHGLALLCGRPLVVHRRVDFAPRHPWKYRSAAATIAVSEAVAAILTSHGVERVHVVHDGVPPAPRGVAPVEWTFARPLWGAAGALVPHKGHRFAVDAMRALPGTLILAGEGPERPALEAQIAAAGLTGRVHLLGQFAELPAFFAAIDAFVHPSVEEGMGQVVVEALAAGCRVVGTRAGGVPEVLEGVGVLVPQRDAEALAEGMRAALGLARGAGVERAESFSVERMVAGTEAVYAQVLRPPALAR